MEAPKWANLNLKSFYSFVQNVGAMASYIRFGLRWWQAAYLTNVVSADSGRIYLR
jgi:hypothetical protein